MAKVDVLAVMEFCSKGFVNGSQCTDDLLAARDAVAELVAAANQAWGMLPVNTPQSDRLHVALARVEGDA